MTTVDDLARWLGEQLDADQRIAEAAPRGPWAVTDAGSIVDTDGGRVVPSVGGALDGRVSRWPEGAIVDHVLAHDPARVLREIGAKRQIVDAYLPPGSDPHPGLPCINYEGQRPIHYDDTEACWRHLESSKRLLHHDYVLRLLAAVYADRPGYQEAWQP